MFDGDPGTLRATAQNPGVRLYLQSIARIREISTFFNIVIQHLCRPVAEKRQFGIIL